MNTRAQTPLEKIQKVSKIVRMGCKIFGGLALFSILLLLVMIITGKGAWPLDGGDKIPMNQFTTGAKILAITVVILGSAVAFKGIYHLHKLFANYAKGEIFTTGCVAQIKQLGITFLLAGGLSILELPVGPILIKLCKPATATVVFDYPFFSLLTGGLIILLSWVMDAGRGLREEGELTI